MMATCKECLHYEACRSLLTAMGYVVDGDGKNADERCDTFTDKSKCVEQIHARWDECDWVKYDGHGECIHYPKAALRCSNCCNAFKKELLWKDNYCPNCGAKMDGESDGTNIGY